MLNSNIKDLLKPAATILIFFILLFGFTKLLGPLPFSVTSVSTQKTDTFNVTGEGKVIVKPDIALINAGITVNGTTVKGVQDQINKTINQVSDAIKNLGVDAKDIQTSNYNIHPNYDYTSGSQRITGYGADTTLTIKVRDLDKLNNVIDAATNNGANQISNISFDIDDKTKARDEARQKAVAEAKEKAQQAAKIAGFSLGRIVNYNESFSGEPPPLPIGLKVTDSRGSGAPATDIQPGSSEVVINVTLSYELKF